MQQITKRRIAILTIFAYIGFLVSWGMGQILTKNMGESGRYFSLLFFYIVYMTIFGIGVPLFLSKQFNFRFHVPVSKCRKIAGIAVLLLVLVIGVFNPDALPILSKNPPSITNIIKYFLLFLPMALGICLQSFFLIPRVVEAVLNNKYWGSILAVIIAAFSFGLGFLIDTLFTDIELAITMAILGIFFGLGAILTRSLYLTYSVLFVVMLVNTLAEARYFKDPWGILIVGFGISCAVVIYFLVFKRQRSLTVSPRRQRE